MQTSLIDQGLNLMLYGMGTVFVFLTILVFATTLMSKLVSRFASEEVIAPAALDDRPANEPAQPATNIRKAIELAIAKHRQR